MKLYYSPGACSLSPHIVLREAGHTFDMEQVDLGTKKTKSGADYTKVNPKGYVPALVLDTGDVLTEGPAIVQYLADKAPAAKLAPANGSLDRYRLQEWLNFTTSELHKSIGGLFNDKLPAEAKEIMKAGIAQRLKFLDAHLAKNDYVMGKEFSVVDAYVFTVLGWGKWVGVDVEAYPSLKAYMGRIAGRPKVQEALKAEGLA
ncbi:MAG: glutathione transferase GstA [Hyphomicrobiaceae bacterium]